ALRRTMASRHLRVHVPRSPRRRESRADAHRWCPPRGIRASVGTPRRDPSETPNAGIQRPAKRVRCNDGLGRGRFLTPFPSTAPDSFLGKGGVRVATTLTFTE